MSPSALVAPKKKNAETEFRRMTYGDLVEFGNRWNLEPQEMANLFGCGYARYIRYRTQPELEIENVTRCLLLRLILTWEAREQFFPVCHSLFRWPIGTVQNISVGQARKIFENVVDDWPQANLWESRGMPDITDKNFPLMLGLRRYYQFPKNPTSARVVILKLCTYLYADLNKYHWPAVENYYQILDVEARLRGFEGISDIMQNSLSWNPNAGPNASQEDEEEDED